MVVHVDNPDLNYMKEKKTLGLEEQLASWVDAAKQSGMSQEDAVSMLSILWEDS